MFVRILTELYRDSPEKNLAKVRARLTGKPSTPPAVTQKNKVLDDILALTCLPELLAIALARFDTGRFILAGAGDLCQTVAKQLQNAGRTVECRHWDWEQPMPEFELAAADRLTLFHLPVTEAQWQTVAALKQRYAGRLIVLTELLLPFSRITFLQGKLDYAVKDLPAILPFYMGQKFFGGPLEKLDAVCPLRGKRVIEFGPFDGCQTAGLIHLGAASVTCIEARAENATKTLTAKDVFGWSNVQVVLEDFHNADQTKYGRFDLAFAHGVYYHSIAPFVFLENLLSLSDRVFLGGFCATDELPASPWEQLSYQGRTYRAKRYREAGHYTAGVNRDGWFFHGDDLIRFFTEHGWQTEMISTESPTVTAGLYLRFLATKS